MAKYKLVAGRHTQNEIKDGKVVMIDHPEGKTDRDGKVLIVPKEVRYNPGDEFEALVDLVKTQNRRGSIKFEYAGRNVNPDDPFLRREGESARAFAARMAALADDEETAPALPAADELDSMTVEQLRKMAKEDRVDLGTAKSKDEIIKAIRAALIEA